MNTFMPQKKNRKPLLLSLCLLLTALLWPVGEAPSTAADAAQITGIRLAAGLPPSSQAFEASGRNRAAKLENEPRISPRQTMPGESLNERGEDMARPHSTQCGLRSKGAGCRASSAPETLALNP